MIWWIGVVWALAVALFWIDCWNDMNYRRTILDITVTFWIAVTSGLVFIGAALIALVRWMV